MVTFYDIKFNIYKIVFFIVRKDKEIDLHNTDNTVFQSGDICA